MWERRCQGHDKQIVSHFSLLFVSCVTFDFFLLPQKSFHQEFKPPGSGSIVARIYADGLTRVLVLEDAADAKRATHQQQALGMRQLFAGFGDRDASDEHSGNAVTKMAVGILRRIIVCG